MRRFALLALIVAVSGCGNSGGDPEDSLLKPGDTAIIVGEQGVIPHDDRDETLFRVLLAPGTRVTIGHDPGFYQETKEGLEEFLKRREEEAKTDSDRSYIERRRKAGPTRDEVGKGMSKWRPVKIVVES